VLVGFLLGAVVGTALPTIARMGTSSVTRLRSRPGARRLLGPGIPEADAATRRLPAMPS
jgi:hypothetical protein